MKATEKQFHTIPKDPEEQAKFLQQLMREIGDKDLFPEKTTRAKRFLEALEKNQQRLIP